MLYRIFENVRKTYRSTSIIPEFGDASLLSGVKDWKVIIRQDSRVRNVETKMYNLEDQLAEILWTPKKTDE